MAYQVVGRRQSLKYLGILTSSAAGQAFLAAWLPPAARAEASPPRGAMAGMDCTQEAPPQTAAKGPYTLQFFKPDEFSTVETLTELIIPADDKPGAKEAGVAQYIDSVLAAASEFKPSLQEAWTNGLGVLDHLSRESHGRPFRELTSAQQ
ncbi:MAG: gluconate 2-dehydrogenase subunit 3 family protein, partial [Terriglobia bacterium]